MQQPSRYKMMRTASILFILVFLTLTFCKPVNNKNQADANPSVTPDAATMNAKSGYSEVNGIKMYYEIYIPAGKAGGQSKPLVLIHGGGSTIQTSFGRIIPNLAGNFKVIAVELQNHGRTDARKIAE